MFNKFNIKATFISLICIMSFYFVLPNFVQSKFLISEQKISLGLDLQGGSYLLMQVDLKAYIHEKLDILTDEIKEFLLEKNVSYKKIYADNDEITLLSDKSNRNLINEIKQRNKNLELIHQGNQTFFHYDKDALNKIYSDVINESIVNIQRRLDQSGTKEITVQRHGKDKISLQVPGIHDTEQIKSLLGKTAKLSFHLLADIKEMQKINHATTVLMSDAAGRSYPVLRKIELSGDSLNNASSGFNNMGSPIVTFKFNAIAAKKFAKITKENTNKLFAIVLDNMVLTAPMIREPILGGQGEISGNFTIKTANELAIMLKSGALPAPLHIIEERTVGPSLGSESINNGKMAAIFSVVAVSIFIIIAYGFFGVLAVISLIFNIIFVLLILTIIQSTLTLPGIAGIALTVGMSVDANVLIFERIREEIKKGKKLIRAVEEGFKNAMSTIFDSNITTLIAALVMFMIGSGPISGFAVTLSVGIICSMFSAITLTKLFIDLWMKIYKPQALNI